MKNERVASKKKIVHILKSSIYSGAENVVLTIMRELRTEFDFIYIATEGTIRKQLEKEKIPFVLLSQFNRKNLEKVLQTISPDIVHAHDFSATVLCATIPGKFQLISHLHYDPPWVNHWNLKTLVYAICHRRIQQVLTVSENAFEAMVFAKLYREKLQVVGNPIDGERIRRLSKDENVDLKGKVCNLIFVGRFVEQKNPQRFIHIVHTIKEQYWPDIRVWMLGDGDLWKECTRLIKELGLQKNIELKGFVENPYPYIRCSDIMCITSRWEGFGLVAAEANILGVPVLSTNTSGCREILKNQNDALCENDTQFVTKIQQFHENADIYELFKQRSLIRGNEFDNVKQYMMQILTIYRELK